MKFAPGAWDRLKNMRTWRKVHGAWCSHFSARCLLSLRACRRRDEADTRLTGCRESNRVTKTDRCQDATAEQDKVGARVRGSSSEGIQPRTTRCICKFDSATIRKTQRCRSCCVVRLLQRVRHSAAWPCAIAHWSAECTRQERGWPVRIGKLGACGRRDGQEPETQPMLLRPRQVLRRCSCA